VLVGVLTLLVLKGPGAAKSVIGIKKCDPGDWGLLASVICFTVICECIAIFVAKSEYEFKKEISWEFLDGDYTHSMKILWKYPIITFIATFGASLIGTTPAFVYVPFFISLAMPMDCVVQTNAVVTLLATTSITFLNSIFKKVPWDYFGMVVIFTALGTYLGAFMQRYVKEKTGKIIF